MGTSGMIQDKTADAGFYFFPFPPCYFIYYFAFWYRLMYRLFLMYPWCSEISLNRIKMWTSKSRITQQRSKNFWVPDPVNMSASFSKNNYVTFPEVQRISQYLGDNWYGDKDSKWKVLRLKVK